MTRRGTWRWMAIVTAVAAAHAAPAATPAGQRIVNTAHLTVRSGTADPVAIDSNTVEIAVDALVEAAIAAERPTASIADARPQPLAFTVANPGNAPTAYRLSAATDRDGWYKFITVKPGAYPWGNHANAWRPAHIHFSLFGRSFLSRLVTQMYFPGDPLFPFDPIFNSVGDPAARARLVSSFDLEHTVPSWALCYRFDIVLRGRNETSREQ